MHRKFRKAAAIIMAAALMLQPAARVFAEEEVAVASEEVQTEVTETEPPQTEAPQTDAPETEAPQTEAPQTEAPQTEPPQTEAPQTEAPQTDAPQTEAPQTEAPQTEAPQTETDTEKKESEKKESEKETEKQKEEETEKAIRKNSGKKFKADDIVSRMQSVLSYLFVAESFDISEGRADEIPVLTNEEASEKLNGLNGFSLDLADAQSTSDVEVLNIYANKDGGYDTSALDAMYSDHVIDVTNKYYVVNVIAAEKDQNLRFSGYDMKNSGQTVSYDADTQPGDILYNFAYLDGEEYKAFEGEIVLSDSSELQGTFVAPRAEVSVESGLSGAVYARSIRVSDSAQKLLRIVYIDGAAPSQPQQTEDVLIETEDAQSESMASENDNVMTETEAESESETQMLPDAPTEPELETEIETEAETEPETEAPEEISSFIYDSIFFEEEEAIDMEEMEAMNTGELGIPAKLSVLDSETAAPLTSGRFILKKGETVLKNEAGAEIVFAGTEIDLSGFGLVKNEEYTLVQIQAQEGYQVAAETKFTPDIDTYPVVIINKKIAGDTVTLSTTTEVLHKGVVLHAAAENTNSGVYAAMFKKQSDDSLLRVSAVEEFKFSADAAESQPISFPGLTKSEKYILGYTDAYGNLLTASDVIEPGTKEITVGTEATQSEPKLSAKFAAFPDDIFYFLATVTLTKKLEKADAKAKSETFYAKLKKEDDTDVESFMFVMNNATSAKDTKQIKVAKESAVFKIVETDKDGIVAETSSEFPYGIEIAGNGSVKQEVEVQCFKDASSDKTVGTGTITNKLNPTEIYIHAIDKNLNPLAGVTMVIKNQKGKILSINNKVTYSSGKTGIKIAGLTPGQTYYLSEISAPNGYAPAEDVPFVVERGQTNNVNLIHAKAKATKYELTAAKQVYSGKYQVYARDLSSKKYASEGRYTFYAALFKDESHLIKVSDVQKIEVTGFTGTTTFTNLEKGAMYYLAETNQYGQPVSSSKTRTVQYSDDGEIVMKETKQTATIQNIYSSLPKGYRYTASMTIEKIVTDSEQKNKKVDQTFSIGIYKKSDYSDTPTVIKMELKNASDAKVKKRILLSGEEDMVYYIAELDEKGKRVTESSDFKYNVKINTPELVLSKGDDKTVTVTNEEKQDFKVELYITKRVYKGSKTKKVTNTFYAGLFKDPEFKQPYSKVIPLNLKDKSKVTMHLTLNFGSAKDATIYVAEVDKNGNVIKAQDQKAFGYEIKLVNSKAQFDKPGDKVQSVLINSIYGSSKPSDWNDILDDNGGHNSGSISDNGVASDTTTKSVDTGDETPIALYVGLMAAAILILLILLFVRRKRR